MVMLENDKQIRRDERERTLSERVPALEMSGMSAQDLQVRDLSQKIYELKGKMKRPNLKRVRVSADAMLGALLGSKVKESVDFKANLKTVKKEEEKKEEVTDWRKNVDAMSGMEGRKKLFDAGQ
ncbi:troponin I, slow skeletal muscle-like isoform X1 [Dunckerocampus dactyliophorus]|uniref:troponin I, slow skeletal muscle-like isoform X1 n=1 Tax=Dunckerocampus dactyliophorus TaxID=161453 RepID=UPI002405F861|nr:troponin I, slow skeletal muscle-like isoform X1 [Dunckerocampus dactyliophorus]